jgi:hypothetical protein
LLGANDGNPTGHWEPLEALNLNEAFLRSLDSSWFDPRLPPHREIAFDSPRGQAFVDQIAESLERYATKPLLLIKEPRITALTEFWFAAAGRVGFGIAAVVAVRHPAEVAGSLAARDGVPAELSNTLWLKYNSLADERSRRIPRVFVEYPNLLTNWKREVDRVARALDVDLSSRKEREITAFLSPDLRHQRLPTEVDFSLSTTSTQRVYRILSMASRDEGVPGSEIEKLVAAHMASSEAKTAVEQFSDRFSSTLRAPLRTEDAGPYFAPDGSKPSGAVSNEPIFRTSRRPIGGPASA